MMNSLLTKLKSSSRVYQDAENKKSSEAAAEENALGEEQDTITGGISGTLAISDLTLKTPTDTNKDFHYDVPCDGSYTMSSNVSFEVISAEVVKEGRSGHVNYTILMKPHKDALRTIPTVVKRRYSDFEHLHQQLRKGFPSIMANVAFPRKVLLGNFTSETIAKRSTAFEQYLTHLFSFFEIRFSSDFLYFFVLEDFSDAIRYFVQKDYGKAVLYFEKILPVLEKLYGDSHPHVLNCLCGLVVSYMKLEKYAVAEACSQVALKCMGAINDETMASLLMTSIRLCWTLGKDKQDLEKKVQDLKSKGVSVIRDLNEVLNETFQFKSN
ncbi:sorting nexin-21 [Biomphalaria pfeifferi]|uniref:Sorting nexin-21 n=1 Tax=Biomphalaria pfeifferi TaxID=112525 RepID=A0AAD8FEH1_BIOPF|nr:sorting nexin-21 [Biomphalaria pfeifferi]